MKYTALTPIKHDGKRIEEGEPLTLDNAREAARLEELGAIERAGRKRASSDDEADALAKAKAQADAEAEAKAAAEVQAKAQANAGKPAGKADGAA